MNNLRLISNLYQLPTVKASIAFDMAFPLSAKTSIWIRNIYHEPSLPDNREWVFWQYASRGHLDGISTYVDLNVFNGNIEEYNKLKTNL